MESNALIVERQLLSDDNSVRAHLLKEYFCEMLADASSTTEGWIITLRRPPTPDYYIDPQFANGLRWWAETFSPINIDEVPFAFNDKLGFQLSFQDSWTLYSWSNYLSSLDSFPHEVVLLHLDDHDDFMPPRLLLSPMKRQWTDAITKLEVDLLRPESVKQAIESGAVGIGSFLAPLLHLLPRVHIRHLCSTGYASQRIGLHIIKPEAIQDNLLAPGALRPAIKLERVESMIVGPSHNYLVTDDLDLWLSNLPNCPVFLHIDMDYFNNRFNGDSDWIHNGAKYDPSKAQVLSRIDSVFAALQRCGIGSRIVNIHVALSPGFFPVDLWSSSIDRIQSNCKNLV